MTLSVYKIHVHYSAGAPVHSKRLIKKFLFFCKKLQQERFHCNVYIVSIEIL